MDLANFNEMTFDPDSYDQHEPVPSGYKTTGVQIPITRDELFYGVIDQLRKYDDLMRNKQSVQYDPYQEPILYTTSNGQSVQVPTQIQQEAIQDWIQQRQILDEARQQEHTRLKQSVSLQESKPKRPLKSKSSSSSYVLWIFIGIVIIYLIYTHKK
jgi:hypothetical protein